MTRALFALIAALAAQLASAQTLPPYNNLMALPGGMEGAPIVVSNNPESVTREGLLLASDPMSTSVPGRVNRVLSQGVLDGACASGSMREFAFYMHHILKTPTGTDRQVDRIFVFVEPASSGGATFNAYGAAISQRDVLGPVANSLDPGRSPSYSVSLAALSGQLPDWVNNRADNFGSRFINLQGRFISRPFPLVVLRGGVGSSLDARIKIRATSGCLRVRVVAASAAYPDETSASQLGRSQYAWGNVHTTAATVGGAPCSDAAGIGWGRPAGIYRFERWSGSTSVSITNATSSRGWQFLAAPPNSLASGSCVMNPQTPTPSSASQRAPALRYYQSNNTGVHGGRDSDPNSTASYGGEYLFNLSTTNRTGSCVTARLQITAYPGRLQCSATGNASRHYDGAFRVRENGTALPLVRAFVKCPTGPTASTIASRVLRPNETVDWNVQGFIPGLIAAPGGLLLNTVPAVAAGPGC